MYGKEHHRMLKQNIDEICHHNKSVYYNQKLFTCHNELYQYARHVMNQELESHHQLQRDLARQRDLHHDLTL